jgi:DNA-directed RNA polymerase specialized sigma24 family protein
MNDSTGNIDPSAPEFSKLQGFEAEPVSPEIAARSRKNQALILRAINDVTAATIADNMSVHESSVSRFKSGGALAYAARLLASAGLKVVPADAIVYTQPDDYR